MLYLRALKKYAYLPLVIVPIYLIITQIWGPSPAIKPYPMLGFAGNIEQTLPLLLLIPLSFLLPDSYEIELSMVSGTRTSRLVQANVLAMLTHFFVSVYLFVLLFRHEDYVPSEYEEILIPIHVPDNYHLLLLLSSGVTLLFFASLFLFVRVALRNCYIPVGIGLLSHVVFKTLTDDIQKLSIPLGWAVFDPFISSYLLSNEVSNSYGLPPIWTINRLLFFILSLILLIITYLLLRREKLHESLGD